MHDKYKILIGIICVILFVVGTCYYVDASRAENTISIGVLHTDHDAPAEIAEAQGLYKKEGINVEIRQFNNGGDLMTAMASGDIDIGYVGITPALGSIQKGVPVKIVSGVQTEGSAVVVGSDSGITNITQLKGKEVASPGAYSIQNMLLMYELSKYGISIDEVNIKVMKVPFMSNSLRAGQVDAISTYEPYVSLATNIGYGKAVSADMNGKQ